MWRGSYLCCEGYCLCLFVGVERGRSRGTEDVKLLYPGRSVETSPRLTSFSGEVTFPPMIGSKCSPWHD